MDHCAASPQCSSEYVVTEIKMIIDLNIVGTCQHFKQKSWSNWCQERVTVGQGVLRSAVGMAHVWRSGLVMGSTTSYFPLIVLGYHLDPNRSYGPLSDTL